MSRAIERVMVLGLSRVKRAAVCAAAAAMSCSPARVPAGSFAVTAAPAGLALEQGGEAVATITVDRAGASADPIAVSLDGLPAGVSADPLTIPAGGNSGTLVFHASASAPLATRRIAVQANGAGASLVLSILAAEADAVAIGVQPADLKLGRGGEAELTVDVRRTGAFRTQTLRVTASQLPPGVTADEVAVAPTDDSVVLTLHASADAPSLGLVPAELDVFPSCAGSCPPAVFTVFGIEVFVPFEVAFAAPTISIVQGTIASAPFRVTYGNGPAGPIVVHVAQLPCGVVAPDLSVAPGASEGAISFAASAAATPGSTSIEVTASNGGFATSQTLTLAVLAPAPDLPAIRSFAPEAAAIFVGERTRLSADFDGDSASIDGIGPVQSGVAIDTPLLSQTTRFTLRVRRGDQEAHAQTAVQVSYRNRIRPLEAAPFAQVNHLAAALPDGRAMVMGGNTSETSLLPDSTLSQVFDPATEKLVRGPELRLTAQAQAFTSLAPLSGGGFLLAGTGLNDGVGPPLRPVATQVFDPAAGSFTRSGDVTTPGLADRLATPLADGGVLLTGGAGPNVIPVANADRYDPATGSWHTTGPMLHVREGHTATLLRDGRVLIAGGVTCCQAPNPSPEFFASTAEIYDPATGEFTATGPLAAGRGLHAAALLADGRVLIAGGDGNDPSAPPLNAEIYDPATGRFTPAGALRAPRDSHAAVTLIDGRVLVIGGEVPPTVAGMVGQGVSSTEIFDPATGSWSEGPKLDPAFFGATVTLLRGGKVLVFGGGDGGGFPQAAASLFE